jgi:hypothetical protein
MIHWSMRKDRDSISCKGRLYSLIVLHTDVIMRIDYLTKDKEQYIAPSNFLPMNKEDYIEMILNGVEEG